MHAHEAATALLKKLSFSEEFSAGAKKIASFFRASEEHIPPGELLCALLDSKIPQKQQEYLLFSILNIGVSDFDLMKSLERLQRLGRLFGRHALFPNSVSELESQIIDTLHQESPVRSIDDITIARSVTSRWVEMFFNGEEPGALRRKQMTLLYKCEARALRARSDWLSEHADTYNMKTMARLLPLISVSDESAKAVIDLAEYIEKGNMPGTPVLSFELAMKTDAFEKWLQQLSKIPECALAVQVIKAQRTKRIPNRLLVAVTTLTRAIHGDSSQPLSWIAHAIGCSTSNGFCLDAGTHHPKLTSLLNQSGTEVRGTVIWGDFLKNTFTQLTGDDNLTRVASDSREYTIRELVNKCMRKDSLLLRLLDNPKVYNAPGLIERIASTNHSLAILQKIAITRTLHTGQANAGVPIALLRNPTNIPISILRSFINTRYISMFEMKDLIRSPYGIRRVVYDEVKALLERKR